MTFGIEDIYPFFPLFRCTVCMIVVIFGSAGCIAVFRKFDVNYLYIFEIDPSHRMREMQMLRLAMVLLFFWLLSFIFQYTLVKFKLFGPNNPSIFSFFLFLFLLIFIFFPFNFCFRKTRIEFVKALAHIIIAPFGLVKFRHFFLADILTSLTKPLQDFPMCACFFFTEAWIFNEEPKCSWIVITVCIIGILPFWWRFGQCLNKYHETKAVFPHLINAGKYTSGITVAVIHLCNVIFDIEFKGHWIIAYVISTLYCYVWDITMDWGLMRTNPKNPFLREKIMYPRWMYYFAMITNLILRLTWTLTIADPPFIRDYLYLKHTEILLFALLELYRRSQWALFRIENENINNYEKYRTVLEIPRVQDHNVD